MSKYSKSSLKILQHGQQQQQNLAVASKVITCNHFASTQQYSPEGPTPADLVYTSATVANISSIT